MRKIAQHLPLKKTQTLVVTLLIVLAVIAHILPAPITDTLVYHYHFITDGQYWRLITGHLLHTNTNHLLLNLAGAVLLWLIHGHYYTIKNYVFLLLFLALGISGGLYFYSPELIQYVGLSGILHGLFTWGVLHDICTKQKGGYLLLIGIIAKVTHEQVIGASDNISKIIGANVAVDAHLWGLIMGIIAFFIMLCLKR